MSHVFGAGRKDADGDAVLVAEQRQEPPLQLQSGQTRPVEPRTADSRHPQGENSFPRPSAQREVTAECQSVLGNTLLTSPCSQELSKNVKSNQDQFIGCQILLDNVSTDHQREPFFLTYYKKLSLSQPRCIEMVMHLLICDDCQRSIYHV